MLQREMLKPAWAARLFARLLYFLLTSVALAQPALLIETLSTGQLQLRWAHGAVPVTLESAASLSEPFTSVTETPVALGADLTLTLAPDGKPRFFRLRETIPAPLRAATVVETSPVSGESGVSVTRETVIRLDAPLAENSLLPANSLYAEAAGRRLLTRTELGTDRRSLSLFYLEPLPAAARVRVTLDGGLMRDAAGFDLDADGDSVPGGIFRLNFQTLNNVAVGETAVRGRVFASEKNPDGSDRPLAGVTITVNGMEETLRVVTAADGSFVLQPAPAGRFFVQVDGRTVAGSQWPGGAYYPFVGKAWSAVAGRTDNLAGGSGVIYLPYIQPDVLRTVSTVADTRVAFAPSVLAANPALAGVEIMVPANSLYDDNGARGGRVGIAPVPADRLPEPLPAGLVFPLVITIQTDGPSNFDRPVPVRFPNLPDPVTGEKLGPGAKTALWSFNHDTGRWEIQGPMTITSDGNFAVTDPGVGVRQPGWHGWNPGSWGDGPGGPGGGGGGGGGGGDCENEDCDDEPKFEDPLGECVRKGVKAFKGTVELVQDILELGETFTPFNPKKCAQGFLEGAASALVDCGLEQFDGDECANDFRDEALSSTAGCVPYAGGIAKGLFDAVLLSKDFYEAFAACDDDGSSSAIIAPLGARRGRARPTAAGLPDDYLASMGTAAAELGRQLTFSTVTSNLFATLYGSERWSGIDSPAAASAWFSFFGAVERAVDPESEGGPVITPTERSALLQEVRPNGASEAEAGALVDQVAALAAGTRFSDAAFRARLGPASAQFLKELEARTADGWTFALDGMRRALLASTQAQQAMLNYARQAGSVSGAGSGGGSGGGGGGSGGGGAAAGAGPMPPPRAERLWLIANLETGFVQRGRLNSAGRFDPLILSPQNFHVVLYSEPERKRIGAAYFISARAGQSTTIPTAMLIEDDFPDTDGDQLSNLVEGILGTSPGSADSDGDGVPDGAEFANRSNPLDNLPPTTGVVASVDTPGTALDVAVVDNFAVVADGPAGFSLLDVSDPFAPVLVAQLDLATNPKAVAVSGDRALLASGTRFYLADISTPSAPVIVADVALAGVNRVAVAGRTGFVTSGAKVLAVDLVDGRTLGEVTLPSVVGDLAVTRDLLLALTTTELRVLRIRQLLPGDPVELVPLGALAIVGSNVPLGDGRRLFAAGNRAYAGYFQGYSIIDLTDPSAPVLLAKEPAIQAAMHDLAADGSGQLVSVTSFAGSVTLAVSVYDVRDEGDVTKFLASWNTPGQARALTLHRGLAFVADGTGGMQTVSFRTVDLGVNGPAIQLEALLPQPGIAESTGNLRLIANTTDDVMVREVEFYVDGTRVATDGNLPFEWHGTAPAFTSFKTNFVVRAKATDTGGNARWSDELVIGLQDTTPLRLVGLEPAPGSASFVTPITQVRAQFDEPLDVTTVSATALTLTGAGPNQVRGDADDVSLPGVVQVEAGDSALVLKLAAPLATGRYRGTIAGNLADLNQIAVSSAITWDFEVLPPKAKVIWPESGSVKAEDGVAEVRAQFDVPMETSTLTAANVQVVGTGLDGVSGNADDVAVTPTGVDYDAANRIVRWHRATPLAADRYTVRLRRDITSTAGHRLTNDFTWSFTVRGPQPKAVWPEPGSIKADDAVAEARAQFDVPMNAATMTAANVQVLGTGPDGIPGNADDVAVTPTGVDYDAANRIVRWHRATPLAADRYTVRLRRELTSSAGNRLTNDFTWSFDVRGPLLWTRDSDGLWRTATNWSTGKVPDRDFVVIDRPGELTVTGISLNTSLGWLRSAESLRLGSSTVRFGGDSFVRGALSITNSTLVASNRFEVGGPLVLDNSTLTASLPLQLTGPLTLRRRSALDGVSEAAGPLTIDGTGTKTLREAMHLTGLLTLREGPLALPASTLTLAAGAELIFAPANAVDAQRDAITSGGDSAGTLLNLGTIRHQGEARPLNFQSVNLTNHGVIEVVTGSLVTQSGRFDQSSNGRIRVAGPANFQNTAGEWAGELTFLGGVTAGGQNVTLRGVLDAGEPGLVVYGDGFTVRSPLTLRRLETRNNARLHVFDTLDVTGPASFSATDVDGDGLVRTRGSLTVVGLRLAGSVRFEHSGILLLPSSRRIDLSGTTVFHNTPAGTVDISGTLAGLFANNTAQRIVNEGRIRAAGTGDLTKNFQDLILVGPLENRGRIEVETGRLSLDGASLHTGPLTVAAGAVVRLDRQQSAEAEHRFAPSSTVTGGGLVELGNATAVVEGAWQVGLTRVAGGILKFPTGRQLDRLEMAGGVLQPDAVLELTERLDWQGGSLTGPGVLRLTGQFHGLTNQFPRLQSGGRFELASVVELDVLTATASEPGTLWHILPGAALTVHRGGSFGSGDVFTPNGAFLNEGRLTKSPTNGGLSFLAPLTNAGVITVQGGRLTSLRRLIQTAGQFRLEGGILRVDGGNGGSNGNDTGFGFDLDGGEFIGVGVIEAQSFALRPFTNNAALRPGLPIGRLTFNYVNYAQTTNGVLEIELGGRTPGTEFDQLQCGSGSRVKALAGTLEVKLVNDFMPAIGDRFLVVSGSLPGSNNRFTTTHLPALPAGRQWRVNYPGGATPGVELQVVAGP